MRVVRKFLSLAVCLFAPACGGDEIERPRFLSGEVPIEYPLQMWDQDVEGETVLIVRVSATGTVDSVRVLESSGHRAFDSAAVEGARHLQFSSARQGGKQVEVWAHVPVRFSKSSRPDSLDTGPNS
ncbi:MAG TPA: hypothetical protein DHW11_04910 [Gemmatimonadetes bacterium]|nr:hypothetical protein [Gemmatimonadota bacterium]